MVYAHPEVPTYNCAGGLSAAIFADGSLISTLNQIGLYDSTDEAYGFRFSSIARCIPHSGCQSRRRARDPDRHARHGHAKSGTPTVPGRRYRARGFGCAGLQWLRRARARGLYAGSAAPDESLVADVLRGFPYFDTGVGGHGHARQTQAAGSLSSALSWRVGGRNVAGGSSALRWSCGFRT